MSDGTTLHLISRSTGASRALEDCLRYARAGDTLLFIQSGVASMPWVSSVDFEPKKLVVRWLAADVIARGLMPLVDQNSWCVVDDEGFVDLVAEHSPVQTWT
jgi:sulfur relay protein TusB/DsrH